MRGLSIRKKKILFVILAVLGAVVLLSVAFKQTAYASWISDQGSSATEAATQVEPTVAGDEAGADSGGWIMDIVFLLVNGLCWICECICKFIYDILSLLFGRDIKGLLTGKALTRGINITAFRLAKGNVYGIVAAYIYATIRMIALTILVLIFMKSVITALAQPSGPALMGLKNSITTVLYVGIALVLMPYIYDVCFHLVDSFMETVMKPLNLSDVLSGKTLSISTGDAPTLQKIIVHLSMATYYIGFGYLLMRLSLEYIFLSLEHVVAWVAFPVVVCHKGTRAKEGISNWMQMVLGLFLTPLVDLVVLAIPFLFLQIIANNQNFAEMGLIESIQVVLVSVLVALSFFKIRPHVRRWFQLNGTMREELTDGAIAMGRREIRDFSRGIAEARAMAESAKQDEEKAEAFDKMDKEGSEKGLSDNRDMAGSGNEQSSQNLNDQAKGIVSGSETAAGEGKENAPDTAKNGEGAIVSGSEAAAPAASGEGVRSAANAENENASGMAMTPSQKAENEAKQRAALTAMAAVARSEQAEKAENDRNNEEGGAAAPAGAASMAAGLAGGVSGTAEDIASASENKAEGRPETNAASGTESGTIGPLGESVEARTPDMAADLKGEAEPAGLAGLPEEDRKPVEQMSAKELSGDYFEKSAAQENILRDDMGSSQRVKDRALSMLEAQKKEDVAEALTRPVEPMDQGDRQALSQMLDDHRGELVAQNQELASESAHVQALMESGGMDAEEGSAALNAIADHADQNSDMIDRIDAKRDDLQDREMTDEGRKDYFRGKENAAREQISDLDQLIKRQDQDIARTQASEKAVAADFDGRIKDARVQAKSWGAVAANPTIAKPERDLARARQAEFEAQATSLEAGKERAVAPLRAHVEEAKERRSQMVEARGQLSMAAEHFKDEASKAENMQREMAKARGEVYYDNPAAQEHAQRMQQLRLSYASLADLDSKEVQQNMTSGQLAQAYHARAQIKRSQARIMRAGAIAGSAIRFSAGIYGHDGVRDADMHDGGSSYGGSGSFGSSTKVSGWSGKTAEGGRYYTPEDAGGVSAFLFGAPKMQDYNLGALVTPQEPVRRPSVHYWASRGESRAAAVSAGTDTLSMRTQAMSTRQQAVMTRANDIMRSEQVRQERFSQTLKDMVGAASAVGYPSGASAGDDIGRARAEGLRYVATQIPEVETFVSEKPENAETLEGMLHTRVRLVSSRVSTTRDGKISYNGAEYDSLYDLALNNADIANLFFMDDRKDTPGAFEAMMSVLQSKEYSAALLSHYSRMSLEEDE